VNQGWRGVKDAWRELVKTVCDQELAALNAELSRASDADGKIAIDHAVSIFAGLKQRVLQRLWPIAERCFVNPLPEDQRDAVRKKGASTCSRRRMCMSRSSCGSCSD
jgi:hypothetical protein